MRQMTERDKGRKGPQGPARLIMSVLLAVAVGLGSALPASAQSRDDIRSLRKQVVRLEKQLRAVQKRVYVKGAPTAEELETEAVREAEKTRSATELLANMEVRIGRIETRLRELTGKVEEAEFRQSGFLKEFTKLQADIEFRFKELEERGVPAKAPGKGAEKKRSPFVTTKSPKEAEEQLKKAREVERQFKAKIEEARLPAGSPEEQYDFAQDLMRRGEYEGAEAAFSAFIAKNPEHTLAGNAQYWLGETFYVRKDYPRAAEAFLVGYQKYGSSSKGPDSLLKLGLTMAGMDQGGEACTILRELEIRYPDAPQRIKRRADAEARRLSCP
ncbi:MAG: tol-pal system protein YbgF [Sphingomonadales bacterium]